MAEAGTPQEKVYLDEDGLTRVLGKIKTNIYDRTTVQIPQNNQERAYNEGEEVTGYTYDSEHVEITFDETPIAVGSYIVRCFLKDDRTMIWTDGTTSPKVLTWRVVKASNYLTIYRADNRVWDNTLNGYVYDAAEPDTNIFGPSLPADSNMGEADNNWLYYCVMRKSESDIVAIIGNESVCWKENSDGLAFLTMNLSGSQNDVNSINNFRAEALIRLIPRGSDGIQSNTTTTITVSDPGDDNHNPDSVVITLNYNVVPRTGAWATASDEIIAEMALASRVGLITLSDYWNVGDERDVLLSPIEATINFPAQPSQTVTFVLTNEGKSTYAPSDSFIVVMKNALEIDGDYPYTHVQATRTIHVGCGPISSGPASAKNYYNNDSNNNLYYSNKVVNSLPKKFAEALDTISVPHSAATFDYMSGPYSTSAAGSVSSKLHFLKSTVKGSVPKHKGNSGEAVEIYFPDVYHTTNAYGSKGYYALNHINTAGTQITDVVAGQSSTLPKTSGYCFWGAI